VFHATRPPLKRVMAIDQALGYCHYRRSVLMFAMQRVKSVRETGETFDRPADFRLDEYLAGSFRALRGEGDYVVVLRFSPSKIPELCMVSPNSCMVSPELPVRIPELCMVSPELRQNNQCDLACAIHGVARRK